MNKCSISNFLPWQDGNGTGQLGGGEDRVSEYSGYSSVISGDLNLDILPLEQEIQGEQEQGEHLQVRAPVPSL